MKQESWNAKFYDGQHNYVTQYGYAVLDLLKPRAGERILDLGCGTGLLSSEIAKSGAQVVGIDSSAEMITEAKNNYPEVTFLVADGHNFHFEQRFDAVFSNAALHWMLEPKKVIQAVANALLPNGRFVLEMGGIGNVQKLLQAIEQSAAELGVVNLPLTNYYPSIAEYAGLLEAQGLQVTYAELIPRPTQLVGDDGICNWVRMFRSGILQSIPAAQHEIFFRRLEEIAKPALFYEGSWWADYVRLRVIARKMSA